MSTRGKTQQPQPIDTQDYTALLKNSKSIPWNKFAYRTGINSADGSVIIMGGASAPATFTPLSSAETLTITYNSTTDGEGTTGARILYIQYLASNGKQANATHVLGSDGSDTTSFTCLGINRVAVALSGTNQINTNEIVLTASTSSTVQATVPAGLGVTQQAIYFCSNAKASARMLLINASKLAGGSYPRVVVRGWVWNRNVNTKFEVLRLTLDAQIQNTIVLNDPIHFQFNPGDVFYVNCETNTNSTDIVVRFSLNQFEL